MATALQGCCPPYLQPSEISIAQVWKAGLDRTRFLGAFITQTGKVNLYRKGVSPVMYARRAL